MNFTFSEKIEPVQDNHVKIQTVGYDVFNYLDGLSIGDTVDPVKIKSEDRKLRDGYGQTVLHHVVRIGDLTIVKSLLDNSNLYTLDENGVSLLHVAAGYNQLKIFSELLLRTDQEKKLEFFQLKTIGNGHNILHFAAKYGHVEMINLISTESKRLGIDLIESMDIFNRTPLALAADLDRSEAGDATNKFISS